MPAISEAGVHEQDFTVTGAAIGDVVEAVFSNELQGCTLTAYVPAADTVRVQLVNNTSSTKTLDPGSLDLIVYKN